MLDAYGQYLKPEDVAAYLGVDTVDDRITATTSAAQRWVEKRRCLTAQEELWLEPDVYLGATIYAALLYIQRVQPQGLTGMDALGDSSEDTNLAMAQVYRMVGSDPVVA